MKIFAIVITYQPDIPILCRVISSIEKQVQGICIIDNGGLIENELPKTSCEILIKHLNENQGIAKATNEGIKILLEKSADYVLLSDQDTIYPEGYVESFSQYAISNNIEKIAAFAPVFFDVNSSEYKPLYVRKQGLIRKESVCNKPTIVFQSIASGLIIDLKKLSEVGCMNEELFIDYVDFEWCWRVNCAGYKIMCLPQLSITHSLGDGTVSVGIKKISEHSSIRYYYITRNTFYLSLYSKALPFLMKIQLFCKACLYPIGYTFLCKPHLMNAKYTLKGMFDGILKRLGKIC